jgi:hypothetical protein
MSAMDPTMQSPRRLPLPAPFDIEVPSGPHFYPIKRWVGSISQGNSPQQAFEALLRHATPFQNETSVDGGTVNILGAAPVKQRVDPDRLMVINTTEPDHPLFPGNVHRSILQEGDDLYVVTHGYGTGVLPRENEWLVSKIWIEPDHNIRHELNPYKSFGNPMDEMNAVPGAVSPPRAEVRGIVSDAPMDFSVNQPPIFSR